MKMLLISLISLGAVEVALAMPAPSATDEVLMCSMNGRQFVVIKEGEPDSSSAFLNFGAGSPAQVKMTKNASESKRNYFHPYYEIDLTEVGSVLSGQYEGFYYAEQQQPKPIHCEVENVASGIFPAGGACCSWLQDKRGCFKIC